MNEHQQQIIDDISAEIGRALNSCEHHRHEEGGNPDKIDAMISSYTKRVDTLRSLRHQLENEFTIVHYDPR